MATAFHESHKPTYFPRTESDTPLKLAPPPKRAVPKPPTKPPPADQVRKLTRVPH